MNQHRTVIIDDEKNCVEVLEILLRQEHPELNIVQTFTNSKEALDYLQTNPVDLIFLDIQMPYMTGLELVQQIKSPSFHIVFTTAFDHYAIEAIRLSALDYLLKPIDEELLTQAIEKFKNKKEDKMQMKMQQLLNHMQLQTDSQAPIHDDRIAVSFQDKIAFYKPSEISYCQSNDNYTTIFLTNGEKITASKTMKHFEEKLVPLGFVRSHQSYLVNSNIMKEYNKKDGGYIVLKDGTNIPVSRQRKEEILQLFKKV